MSKDKTVEKSEKKQLINSFFVCGLLTDLKEKEWQGKPIIEAECDGVPVSFFGAFLAEKAVENEGKTVSVSGNIAPVKGRSGTFLNLRVDTVRCVVPF